MKTSFPWCDFDNEVAKYDKKVSQRYEFGKKV